MERLYALGIDSYRLINVLMNNQEQGDMHLDGVTGTITLGSNHVFEREAVEAEFVDGQGISMEAAEAQQKSKAGH